MTIFMITIFTIYDYLLIIVFTEENLIFDKKQHSRKTPMADSSFSIELQVLGLLR